MFETPTTDRQRDAIRAAHSERARVFAEIIETLRHPLRALR
jgi:hypothetical protein